MLLKKKNWVIHILAVALMVALALGSSAKAQTDPVSFSAQIHQENYGWCQPVLINDHTVLGRTGEHLKMEAIVLNSDRPDQYGFKYRAHVENVGWQDEVGTGQEAGTTGRNLGIEAITITPEGAQTANVQLLYRVHVENHGWTKWVKEGEPAGTVGNNLQLEAIELRLVPRSEEPELADGNVNWGFRDKQNVYYKDVLEQTAVYPHNSSSWIEGYHFYNGKLYESAGRKGHSAVYKNLDLATNHAEITRRLPNEYYAEGSVVLNGKLYVLTYQDNKVLTYNPDSMELLEILPYRGREGWGLTTDGQYLIASDGSSNIYFMDEGLNDQKVIPVTYNGTAINNLNELEYIDGYIWANVWYTRDILVIDPNNGEVVRKIDCSDIYDGPGEVMNGIAFNPETRKVYLTGKFWEKTFEFNLK